MPSTGGHSGSSAIRTKKVLLQDIIIPKGTVFSQTRETAWFFQAVVRLSKNTSGDITYKINNDSMDELNNWFADLIE